MKWGVTKSGLCFLDTGLRIGSRAIRVEKGRQPRRLPAIIKKTDDGGLDRAGAGFADRLDVG